MNTKSKRPLSVRALARLYGGISPSALYKWEQRGVDVMSPMDLYCAMQRSDRGLNWGAAFWRVFESEESVLAHCIAIAEALRAKGLRAADHLDYALW